MRLHGPPVRTSKRARVSAPSRGAEADCCSGLFRLSVCVRGLRAAPVHPGFRAEPRVQQRWISVCVESRARWGPGMWPSLCEPVSGGQVPHLGIPFHVTELPQQGLQVAEEPYVTRRSPHPPRGVSAAFCCRSQMLVLRLPRRGNIHLGAT